jgi:hypothetical protein
LGRLLGARVLLTAGQPVERNTVDDLLAELTSVAGLEAWRLTAMVAAAGDEPRWWKLAELRVAELSDRAGPYAEQLQKSASATLDDLRRARPWG